MEKWTWEWSKSDTVGCPSDKTETPDGSQASSGVTGTGCLPMILTWISECLFMMDIRDNDILGKCKLH